MHFILTEVSFTSNNCIKKTMDRFIMEISQTLYIYFCSDNIQHLISIIKLRVRQKQ